MGWGKSPQTEGPAELEASSTVAGSNDSLANLRTSLAVCLATPQIDLACRASYAQGYGFESYPAHLRRQVKTRISAGFLVVKT